SVQITSDFTRGYKTDIAVALCGPITNLVLFAVLFCNYLCFKNQLILCYALLNLIIALFNLLPVNGLDGGTVLFSVMAKRTDYNRARLILKIITLIIAASVIFVGVMFTLRGKINLSIYIIGIYLLIMSILKS
ncbi:MAG: site-2 protease family protein, partial [Clostridia bacterium]|nr:site-2 protease family protein [Clostridia bacterium]